MVELRGNIISNRADADRQWRRPPGLGGRHSDV